MKTRQKRYNQLIAVDLISRLKEIESNPPPIPGFSISRLEYLISLILSKKLKKHKGSWSVLNMRYMLNVVPRAGEYLNFLKNEGIIEWMPYSSGGFSRKYRLVNEGKTEIRTITDKKLILRIENNKKKISSRNSKKYPQLNRWIRMIEINSVGAINMIENEYKNNHKSDGWRTFALSSVAMLESGEFHIGVNTTNYRLDSNITNLPKELLPFITIKGKPLIEIDISNSQPFFSACLFNTTPEVEKVIRNYLGDSLIILSKSLHLEDYEDVKRYCSLVISGKFYEYMMQKFKENNIPFKDRSDVKKQIFVIFFGKNNAHIYNPAVKVFKKEFRHVYRLFTIIKRKNHNRLAILLQRIESMVILDHVARKISIELADLPFLTKHDSILPFKLSILTSNEKVREIIVDTIKEITGIVPQGRMKRFIL